MPDNKEYWEPKIGDTYRIYPDHISAFNVMGTKSGRWTSNGEVFIGKAHIELIEDIECEVISTVINNHYLEGK